MADYLRATTLDETRVGLVDADGDSVPPERLELPTNGVETRCSIR
jgi:hypothetical protein